MNSSTMAAVLSRSWMKATRSASASSSRTTEARAMPTEASSSTGFTIRGKRRSLGGGRAMPSSISMKRGVRTSWWFSTILVSALWRARMSPVGAGPGVGHAQHLQQPGHGVVQRRQIPEALGQVEDHVDRLGAQAGQQLVEVAAEAQQPDLVAPLHAGSGDLELDLVDPAGELARSSPGWPADRCRYRTGPAPAACSWTTLLRHPAVAGEIRPIGSSRERDACLDQY